MIHDFTYLKPSSLKEALSMLGEHKDECKVICGGAVSFDRDAAGIVSDRLPG